MPRRRLTPKQEAFALAYVELGNATAAYRRAYNVATMLPTTVNRKATGLTQHGLIKARITALQARIQTAVVKARTREAITEEMATLRLWDLSELAEADGQYGPAISAVSQITRKFPVYREPSPVDQSKHIHFPPGTTIADLERLAERLEQ